MRVYLNVDPFDNRFTIRDDNYAVRLVTMKMMEIASEKQDMSQPKRTGLRFRLQPGYVLRSYNKLRFRNDWLRAFMPKGFALYQEDPTVYGFFLLSTQNIRRLRVGDRGIAS